MESSKILSPIQRGIHDEDNDEYKAWCAWEAVSDKWIAVWRYKWTEDTFWEVSGTEDVTIEVDGDLSTYDANELWQFSITNSSATFSELTSLTPPQGTYNSGTNKTQFTIPGVTESPVFLYLDK